jgi:hypothetical protein
MFPAYYLFFGLLGRAGTTSLRNWPWAVMTAVVFGGIPLAACRLRAIARHRFPRSPIPDFVAAAFVGL